ncbi:hypothetical protein VB715_04755 [Crocosphaera sp. UHCC 0190]|uniref:hypothetical protein n=1 Tax=Crocosphaera sp. UHCC 0190 TaxID=3110246 RepID=UPI002B1ED28D|nr:hypothetical protein [Crocosphaera sp. UHCC 0190]MEA5509068.1 hypothetical protein [Crocosphaera sp. UHCC 0190]
MVSKLEPQKFIEIQSTGDCSKQKRKLISIGITPTGIISIGIAPMGILAIGVVPMGVVSFGAVAMGTVATGIVTMGIAAFGVETMSLVNLGRWQVGPVEIKSEPHNHQNHLQPTGEDHQHNLHESHH